jgi:hypothetical protein
MGYDGKVTDILYHKQNKYSIIKMQEGFAELIPDIAT